MNDKYQSTISIAMCTYNGSKYLKEQLESILNQTRKPDEIVICDDCSKDDTVIIAKEILSKWKGKWSVVVNNRNLGFKDNFQKAISLCTGDIIFLSDQDDVWNPEKIEKINEAFRKDSNVIMVFHDAEMVDEKLNIVCPSFWHELEFSPKDFERGDYSRLYSGNVVQGAACAFRRELFLESEPFPDGVYHDEWLAINAALHGKMIPISSQLLKYRQTGSNALGGIYKKSISKKLIDWSHATPKMLGLNKSGLERAIKVWRPVADKYKQAENIIGKVSIKKFFAFLCKREKGICKKDVSKLPSLKDYMEVYKDINIVLKAYIKDRLSVFIL